MTASRNPIRIFCAFCRSTDVSRDAWADWDERDQQWVLRVVYDAAFCHQCEGDTSLREEAIEEFSA